MRHAGRVRVWLRALKPWGLSPPMSLKGGYYRGLKGTTIKVTKGGTRSLDYGSYQVSRLTGGQ